MFFIFFLGVISMLLGGCFGEKYPVDYNGDRDFYKNARDYYRAGELVTVYYDLIATDTDYTFYLDDEIINVGYDDKTGFIISFTMPDHGVSLRCEWRNSMTYVPAEPIMLIDYYSATVATVGGDGYFELVLISDPERNRYVLEKYEAGEGLEETVVRYLVPESAADECYDIIDDSGMREWNSADDCYGITGAVSVVKFMDGGTYTRVSTEKMPENGKEIIDRVGNVLLGYAKAENIINE